MRKLMLSLSIISLLSLVNVSASFDPSGFKVTLTHVDSKKNLTHTDRLHRAAQRSKYRMRALQSKLNNNNYSNPDLKASVHYLSLEYVVDLAIGTPSQPLSVMLDTGSDLIWTQCQPCLACAQQQNPIYDPYISTTFSPIPCSDPLCNVDSFTYHNCSPPMCTYKYSYIDQTYTEGLLAKESFIIGNETVPNIAFGCGIANVGDLASYSGIMGLSPRKLSLVSQLSSRKFSYCLTNLAHNTSSHLFVGSQATLNPSLNATIQSMPFAVDVKKNPFYYYVPLKGISIGDVMLPIPESVFEYVEGEGGGTIIDSGTSYTHFAPTAYSAIQKQVLSLVNLPVMQSGCFLCFNSSSQTPPTLPNMTLHFDGANMTVPYMSTVNDDMFCMLVLPSNVSISIVGNYQQQDMHLLYDLENGMLSFAPANCDEL